MTGQPLIAGQMVLVNEMTSEGIIERATQVFTEVIAKKKLELVQDLFHPLYNQSKNPFSKLSEREGFALFCRQIIHGFPDIQAQILDIVQQDMTVVVHWLLEGTQMADFMGVEPSNRFAKVFGMSLFKFQDDQIIEAHTSWDSLQLLEQIGKKIC